jgi:hypothetical protein
MQPAFSLSILFFLYGMLPAVELDDQPFLKTDKISDEGADGFLAAKLQAIALLAAKVPPQEFSGVGLPLSE